MATKRPKYVQAMYRYARRVAPGLYVLKTGDYLVNITEVLEDVGLADTEENRRLVTSATTERLSEYAARVVNLGGGERLPERKPKGGR